MKDVPVPRPGQCVDDSTKLPDSTTNFIKTHPLVHENVKPLYGQPIVTHTSRKYKFSALAVDEQVKALDGKTYDVLMIRYR